VVLFASAAWLSLFLVPVPGGPGGVFEIIGLPITVLVVPAMVAMTVTLVLAASIGLGLRKVRP
jgi:hypothetical protein